MKGVYSVCINYRCMFPPVSALQPTPNAVGGLSSTQSLQPTGSTATSTNDRYAALASLDETLRSIKIEEQHQQQPAQQQQPTQAQQTQPFGGFVGGAVNPFGGAPNAQLGTALGPAQQQSNPFLVGQAAPGMQQQVPAIGGFGGQQVAGGGLGTFPGMGQPGGGFPGQIAPTQQQASFGSQQQQFGAFAQQSRPGGQWGQQAGFNPAAQGAQVQWRAQQQMQPQGAVPQQWGAQGPQQMQFAGQQGGFGFRGGMTAQGSGMTAQSGGMTAQSGGSSFGMMNMQQVPHQQPQQQFGGFVSAGQPQQHPQLQQQQKPAGQLNWSSGPTQVQGVATSSSAFTSQKTTPTSVDTGWSANLNKAAPSSTWGLQQQPTSSSTPTGWSSTMLGSNVTMQAGGFSQSGMGGGGFNQPSMSGGGFNQPSMSGGGFNQPSMSGGGFNQPSMGAGGFSQPSMGVGGFNQQSMGGGGFSQPSMGGGSGLQNWNQQPTMQPTMQSTMQPQMQHQPMGGFGSGGGQQPFMSSHPAGQSLSSNPFAVSW